MGKGAVETEPKPLLIKAKQINSADSIVNDFWVRASEKAWVDHNFYRELQLDPVKALNKLAVEVAHEEDEGDREKAEAAIRKSIKDELKGAWTMERLPTPPDRTNSGLAAVCLEPDGYSVSHTHLYPPTCC